MGLVDCKITWNPQEVIRRNEQWKKRFLYRIGGFIRKAAQRSMRKRKKISDPGDPPSAHTTRYKRSILFQVDMGSDSVAIGPMATRVGSVLEQGGMTITADGEQVYIRPRPHMRPALEQGIMNIQQKSRDPLPKMWRASIQ